MIRNVTTIQPSGADLDDSLSKRENRSRSRAVTMCVREYTAGDIVTGTFRIYAANFVPLLMCYLLPAAPFIALGALGASQGQQTLVVSSHLLEFFVSMFAIGAVTLAVSEICLGNEPSVARAYKMIGRVFWRYFGAYLLVVLISVMAAALFVLPILVAGALLLFVLPVAVIERKGGLAAIRRSVALGRANYIRNYSVWFAALLIGMFLIMSISFTFGFVWVKFGLEPDGIIFNLVPKLLAAAAVPIWQIAVVLLYYDMRVRKEHFDQSALSQELFT